MNQNSSLSMMLVHREIIIEHREFSIGAFHPLKLSVKKNLLRVKVGEREREREIIGETIEV
jgi:hypothetical protein